MHVDETRLARDATIVITSLRSNASTDYTAVAQCLATSAAGCSLAEGVTGRMELEKGAPS
jgi:hypothetical protein